MASYVDEHLETELEDDIDVSERIDSVEVEEGDCASYYETYETEYDPYKDKTWKDNCTSRHGGARPIMWKPDIVRSMLMYMNDNIDQFYTSPSDGTVKNYQKKKKLALYLECSDVLFEIYGVRLSTIQVAQKFRTEVKRYSDYISEKSDKLPANLNLLKEIWPKYVAKKRKLTPMIQVDIEEIVNGGSQVIFKQERKDFPRVIVPSKYAIHNDSDTLDTIPSAETSNRHFMSSRYAPYQLSENLEEEYNPFGPPTKRMKVSGKTNYQDMIHTYLEEQNARSEKVARMFACFVKVYKNNMESINNTLKEIKDKLN